ncbi:hypothetical protein MO867_10405 [Microbulbifer sp. OS29]|uniref:Uncharacterized protein n=1 Tax=Microbulbifer okhotskensis TaxID=2926617 RepID=A0A9X2ENA5_9GAMM|nr:hypothetical protein [Microbulbifer okhotskensis]MCO1334750.1 hypothetical protein [Microbulbifer okhotskensis]
MFIKELWADNGGEPERLLSSLRHYLDKFSLLPELVYVVSAGEANVLQERPVVEFIADLEEAGHDIHFVGSACASFHAAVLSYSKTAKDDALVLNLELGKERQQECLDSLGVGTKLDQDGLDVFVGVSASWLCRDYSDTHLCQISSCDILSQAPSLSGAPDLVKNIKQMVSAFKSRETRIVSFDIQSKWAKGLLKGFSAEEKILWLPSIEENGWHYLSIKPLMEIVNYYLKQERTDLWLLTLGGGGRVGCLKIDCPSPSYPGLLSRLVNVETLSLEDAYVDFNSAQLMADTLDQDHLPHIREALRYPKSIYRGRHNQVFDWVLNTVSWRALLDGQGARHG